MRERTVYRWPARQRSEGPEGLRYQPSRPRRVLHRTPRERMERSERLRRRRLSGAEIAAL